MITNKKIINKVEAALDEIRPYLRTDGGDISLNSIHKISRCTSIAHLAGGFVTQQTRMENSNIINE